MQIMDINIIRFYFKYNRKNRLNKQGEALVQIVAYTPRSRRDRRFISTGIYLKPEQWDEKNAIIINHPNSAQLNWKLSDLLAKYNKKVIDIINRKGRCSLLDLELESSSGYMSFIEFFETEIEIAKKTRANGTINTYNSALLKLKDFRKKVYFADLEYRFIQAFDGYLGGLKLRQTVKAKYHKIIKRMIHLAIKKGLLENNPYSRFVIRQGQPEPRTYLESHEIARLEALEFHPEEMYLETERDAFLFSCWTALRNETNTMISMSMFYKDDEGYHLKFTSGKTDKTSTFPLRKLFPDSDNILSKPEQIIEKYIKLNQSIYGHKYKTKPLFGTLVNQTTNKRLKVLASRANIRKKLTTHVGRHSFGTFMANKVPLHILQALMQHGSIKTTMRYVHLSDKIISDGLDNVEW